MSDLDKKRDELAGARYSLDNRASFKMGFDAAVSILQPKLELAVEALEDMYFYSSCSACDNNWDTKDKALAKIKAVQSEWA